MATIAATTGEVAIVGIGTTTITATKAGNSDYNPATARYVLTIIPKVEQAAFAFASTNLTKSFGDAVFTFTPTGGSGAGVITYLSSDTSVATIDATTGEVAIVGGGTTTITAIKAGDSDYHEATAHYNLIITKVEQAAFAFAPTSLTKSLGDAVFTFTPTGGSGTGAITYDIQQRRSRHHIGHQRRSNHLKNRHNHHRPPSKPPIPTIMRQPPPTL